MNCPTCTVQEDLIKDNMANVSEMMQDMEKKHRAEVDELREQYEGMWCPSFHMLTVLLSPVVINYPHGK